MHARLYYCYLHSTHCKNIILDEFIIIIDFMHKHFCNSNLHEKFSQLKKNVFSTF